MEVDSKPNSVLSVTIKHQGKKYDVDVDTSEPGAIFKYQVYSLTGVQPENQKIFLKGRQVKDDTDMSVLGLKAGQMVMVLGQPGAEPVRLQAPEEKPRFIEDMSNVEAARQAALNIPGGLQNLGNTCYLNASLQTMRAIPELQDALVNKHGNNTAARLGASTTDAVLVTRLREVYQEMASSHAPYIPSSFLHHLRNANPRFAEHSRSGPGYAQQDAEEAWTFIMDAVRRNLLVKDGDNNSSGSTATAPEGEASSVSISNRYLAGQWQVRQVCDEEAGRIPEEESPSASTFLTLSCHITISTNHLMDGLLASLTEKITKNSPALGRDATFTKTSQISRLPKYLTVHFVRFYWKREIQKKAKIMRKVTFPLELDASPLCTKELQEKLLPVRERVRELTKDIADLERSNKKRKRALDDAAGSGSGSAAAAAAAAASASSASASASASAPAATASGSTPATAASATETPEVEFKTDAQIEAEKREAIDRAKEELYQLVKPRLDEDRYANHSGLYELRAIVTHQGASADSGHYTAFVKKGSIVNPKTGAAAEADGNWWWFNDDTVTEVTSDRIMGLAGGGESHSALILLYGSVPLPLPKSRNTEPFSLA